LDPGLNPTGAFTGAKYYALAVLLSVHDVMLKRLHQAFAAPPTELASRVAIK